MRYLLPEDIAARLDRFAADARCRVTALTEPPLGRWLRVVTVGDGPRHLAVKANAHADEPAGCVTAARLAEALAGDADLAPLAQSVTCHFLLTANPYGLARNRGWLGAGEPSPVTWCQHVYRDPPAQDREFGYGELPHLARHAECAAWHRYLDALPRLDGYVSLHSMAFAGGAWFLVQALDGALVAPLLDRLAAATTSLDLPLHDEDRGGRKGFQRLRPGFCTAPTLAEMHSYFAAGGSAGAIGLALNSMQVAAARHQTPVALVSELPIFEVAALRDMAPVATARADLDRALSQRLLATLPELEVLAGDGSLEARAELAHRGATARSLAALATQWGRTSAARRDEVAADLAEWRAMAANAAIASRAPGLVGAERSAWLARLVARVSRIQDGLAPRAVPLELQVAAQTRLVLTLAGALT